METPSYLKELTDSVELIRMLEQLTGGLSRKVNGGSEIPWTGMQITLSQTRELISRSLAELCSEAVRESYKGDTKSVEAVSDVTVQQTSPVESRQQSVGQPQAARPATLSERIQQAPSGQNRVRELLTNVTGRRGQDGGDEELVGNDKR